VKNRTGLAVSAWESLLTAQHQLMTKFAANRDVWQGFSVREYDVLYQLSATQRLMQSDLASRLLIPQPSLSRLIDRLVQDGYILRERNPEDGRGSLLTLSETGRAAQRAVGSAHARDVAESMLSRLSCEELETLRELTARLVEK
jgi:DNA-binding MarR family transcriptional regulator